MPKEPVLYEAMYILKPEMSDEEIAVTEDRLKAGLEAQGAEIIGTHLYARRRLAYEIEGVREGIFRVMYFRSLGPAVEELKHEFLMSEEVVRGMITIANPRYMVGEKPAAPAADEEAAPEEGVAEEQAEDAAAEEPAADEAVAEEPAAEAAEPEAAAEEVVEEAAEEAVVEEAAEETVEVAEEVAVEEVAEEAPEETVEVAAEEAVVEAVEEAADEAVEEVVEETPAKPAE